MEVAPDILADTTAPEREEWVAAMAALPAIPVPATLSCVSLSLPDAPQRIAARRSEGRIVLALATAAQIREREDALEQGVDEFLQSGPVEPADLRARLRFLENGAARPDGVEFRPPATVRIDGRDVVLRERGAGVFALLWAARGGFVTHETLLAQTWGEHAAGRREYLRVAIGHMRHALEPEPDLPRYILSEPGVGYRLGDGTPRHTIA
ncbi:winged helix-turn-helix domain-containing protein [uncultured Croceicoccus sp.]|uniref:winged helix-turn-helix domain-containing protein n=1 Tax=uncultured Croceicoccus sp. TaxID=1295329 RepID=UPI002627D8EF|nr:winged helix-turn-helix domain-containing protein [uncultured Croceicoccus sp.]